MAMTVIVGTRGTSGVPEYAGSTWVRLQYMLGLQRLGIEAYWVDRLQSIDPLTHHHSLEYLTRRFAQLARDFGFQDRYCIVYKGGEKHFGMSEGQLDRLVQRADLLINVSGYLPTSCPLAGVRRRAYIDVDPGFTQLWATETDMGFERHNSFFTTGQTVGQPQFTLPTHGIDWHPICPPVVLDAWPPCIDEKCQRFSTVADWRTPQQAVFDGEYYGGKRGEFIRFLRVPLDANQPIDLALTIHQHDFEDMGLLLGNGWRVNDPYYYAGDPYSYREFIQYSRAEFSVAKSGYVKANCGWVSDRTACYLASGKPALVQSTGFEGRLPTGKGLLTFRNAEEAMAGVAAIDGDYLSHCRAARQIAERYFDSDLVLGFLLNRAGVG